MWAGPQTAGCSHAELVARVVPLHQWCVGIGAPDDLTTCYRRGAAPYHARIHIHQLSICIVLTEVEAEAVCCANDECGLSVGAVPSAGWRSGLHGEGTPVPACHRGHRAPLGE